VPAPDPRCADAIANVAKRSYGIDRWAKPCAELGAQMGPGWMHQLAMTMVHPPKGPDDVDPFEWVQRVQIAAALTIAHLDQGWEGSVRKRALTSLALGPVDWTVSAAILAMSIVAKSDPNARRDIEQLYEYLRRSVGQTGFTCYEWPLANAWISLGGHSPDRLAELQAWRDRAIQGAPDNVEKHEGLDLQRYAEFCVKRDEILMRGNMGAQGAMQAMQGGGTWPELQRLCQEFGVQPKGNQPNAAAARVPEWDQRINGDAELQKGWNEEMSNARLRAQGIDPNSPEGQRLKQFQSGKPVDVEVEKARAQQAAQQIAQGEGGDPDPVVFPGQKVAKLSDYVGLMKEMQKGNMNGALAKYGLDMGAYMKVAQAWGAKMASDATLTAKFGKMMAG
jgi:hypothetical protein